MSRIPNAMTAVRLLLGLGAAVVQILALVSALFCLSVVLDY
jgi:hypothetical protein